jgi:integrase
MPRAPDSGSGLRRLRGASPGRAVALERGDVGRDEVTIRQNLDGTGTIKAPKNGRERVVVLPPPAREALVKSPPDGPLPGGGVLVLDQVETRHSGGSDESLLDESATAIQGLPAPHVERASTVSSASSRRALSWESS